MKELFLKIEGMHCPSCESLIREELKDCEAVQEAEVKLQDGSARVVFNPAAIKEGEIVSLIEDLGEYKASISPGNGLTSQS